MKNIVYKYTEVFTMIILTIMIMAVSIVMAIETNDPYWFVMMIGATLLTPFVACSVTDVD
jgi:uncharacterized protein (DUF983 family)